MSFRQARPSSENERGERNCRDERFDYLACHRGTFKRGDCAYSHAKRYYNTCQEMLFPTGRARHQVSHVEVIGSCRVALHQSKFKAAKPSRVAGEMSALGQKRTYAMQKAMSALPPKADMCSATRYVCFVPKADIANLIESPRRRERSTQEGL